MIQIGKNTYAWLWIAFIEPIHYHQILGVYILTRHRNMLVAEEVFLRSLIKLYGKRILYILMMDEEHHWYPEACTSLGLKKRIDYTYIF